MPTVRKNRRKANGSEQRQDVIAADIDTILKGGFSTTELRKRIGHEKKTAQAELNSRPRPNGSKPSRLPANWKNAAIIACENALEDIKNGTNTTRNDAVSPGEIVFSDRFPDDNGAVTDKPSPALEDGHGISVSDGHRPNGNAQDKEGTINISTLSLQPENAKRPSDEHQLNDFSANTMQQDHSEQSVTVDSDQLTEAGYDRRPGPLSNDQLRECAERAENNRAWVEHKAKSWRVDKSTVAQKLGLHNIERRKTSHWNMHQVRFYSTNVRGQGESLDEHRARCLQEYKTMVGEDKELTDEEHTKVIQWRNDLEDWWHAYDEEKTEIAKSHNRRYQVMLDLRKEILDRASASWMSDRWQVEIVGFCVAAAADDPVAQAASFAFAGSDKTRVWWDTRNVPTAQMLADFETLCRGAELQSREARGPFNISVMDAEYQDRDKRTKVVKAHMVLLFTVNGTHKNFRWVEFPRYMIEAKQRLLGWPRNLPCPGGPEGLEALGHEGYRKLYLRFRQDGDADRPVEEKIRYEPWSTAETELDPDDDAYESIPLVIADNGFVMLRIGDDARNKKDRAKKKAQRVIKNAAKARLVVENDGVSDDETQEAPPTSPKPKKKKLRSKKRKSLESDGETQGGMSCNTASKKRKSKKKSVKSPEFVKSSDSEADGSEGESMNTICSRPLGAGINPLSTYKNPALIPQSGGGDLSSTSLPTQKQTSNAEVPVSRPPSRPPSVRVTGNPHLSQGPLHLHSPAPQLPYATHFTPVPSQQTLGIGMNMPVAGPPSAGTILVGAPHQPGIRPPSRPSSVLSMNRQPSRPTSALSNLAFARTTSVSPFNRTLCPTSGFIHHPPHIATPADGLSLPNSFGHPQSVVPDRGHAQNTSMNMQFDHQHAYLRTGANVGSQQHFGTTACLVPQDPQVVVDPVAMQEEWTCWNASGNVMGGMEEVVDPRYYPMDTITE